MTTVLDASADANLRGSELALALHSGQEHVQHRLSLSPDGEIRRALAANPALVPVVARALVTDRDRRVRVSLADNAAVPSDLFTALAFDRDRTVRRTIARNPSLTADDIVGIYRATGALSHDPFSPDSDNGRPEVITDDVELRCELLLHANAPLALLEEVVPAGGIESSIASERDCVPTDTLLRLRVIDLSREVFEARFTGNPWFPAARTIVNDDHFTRDFDTMRPVSDLRDLAVTLVEELGENASALLPAWRGSVAELRAAALLLKDHPSSDAVTRLYPDWQGDFPSLVAAAEALDR